MWVWLRWGGWVGGWVDVRNMDIWVLQTGSLQGCWRFSGGWRLNGRQLWHVRVMPCERGRAERVGVCACACAR